MEREKKKKMEEEEEEEKEREGESKGGRKGVREKERKGSVPQKSRV